MTARIRRRAETPVSPKQPHDDSRFGDLQADPPRAPGASALPLDEPGAAEHREHARAVPALTLTPDVRALLSVSLSEARSGPGMHLIRHHDDRQMQIVFDRVQPGEKYLALLDQAGWTDRTGSEGVWIKDVPEGKWQAVTEAERLFKEIASAIRKDKGLEGLTAA